MRIQHISGFATPGVICVQFAPRRTLLLSSSSMLRSAACVERRAQRQVQLNHAIGIVEFAFRIGRVQQVRFSLMYSYQVQAPRPL